MDFDESIRTYANLLLFNQQNKDLILYTNYMNEFINNIKIFGKHLVLTFLNHIYLIKQIDKYCPINYFLIYKIANSKFVKLLLKHPFQKHWIDFLYKKTNHEKVIKNLNQKINNINEDFERILNYLNNKNSLIYKHFAKSNKLAKEYNDFLTYLDLNL